MRTACAPLGHLIRRQLVDLHPLLTGKVVVVVLDLGDLPPQLPFSLATHLTQDGSVALDQPPPDRLLDDDQRLDGRMLSARHGIRRLPEVTRRYAGDTRQEHVDPAVLDRCDLVTGGDEHWDPTALLDEGRLRLAGNANFFLADRSRGEGRLLLR